MDSLYATEIHSFGGFQLFPGRRLLTLDGTPVPLSSRAFDLLTLLVQHRDRIVTKAEIMSVVWRGTTVDENNLAVQLSALRRTLGDQGLGAQIIVTVPGQGYRFVAPVRDKEQDQVTPPAELDAAPDRSLLPDETTDHARTKPAEIRPGSRRTRILPLALAAGLALLIAAWIGVRRPPAEVPRLSVAVLPFRYLGQDSKQTYLADAISDDLTTDLSHIPGSMVIARESADAYKGKAVSTDTIGKALGVRYLLEGSLTDEGATLHINAQLILAATGAHLWASAFDVDRAGLGRVRTEIVRRLAAVLGYTLVQIEAARSLHDRPDNPDAIDLYLRARSVLDRGNDFHDLQQAQALLDQAIRQAAGFSDALAALGSVLLDKIDGFDDADEWADHARAQAVIGKALALSPQNPVSIIANGKLAYADGQCAQAQESFRLALALEPDNLPAHIGLSKCDRDLGRMQDMVDELQTVLRFDPSGPKLAVRQHLIGMGLLMLGKPVEAIQWFDRAGAHVAGDKQPGASLSWREYRQLYTIAAHYLSGDTARAHQDYLAYAATWPRRTVWRMAAYASHAQSLLPGHVAYCKALHAAGMPLYSDENAELAADAAGNTQDRGDFDPTPGLLPGAVRVSTVQLHLLTQTQPKPLILDVGRGAAAIPGAVSVWPQGMWGDRSRLLHQAAGSPGSDAERAIVVMGDGPLGFDSYDAAADLVAHGYKRVLWYRGGEEAWAAAGYVAEDKRFP